jgi:pimeloyl-ACP methyl ester carboxylesterase
MTTEILQPSPVTSDEQKCKADLDIQTLIVAVHGIGNQYRYATIQSVAHRVASYFGPPVGIPLGSFHPEDRKTMRALAFKGQPHLGLAEVYWANIPREANKDKDTLEEAKAWARTVVQRVQAMDHEHEVRTTGKQNTGTLIDYEKTSAVVSEMIDTIATLENLTFVLEKAGLMKFNLRELLDDYLGDVQIVAEFRDFGGEIFAQFRNTMAGLLKTHPNVEHIHLVAHSEGTVVAFRGLLEALSQPDDPDFEWVQRVKSLMTIGSPIDKHLIMWPALWEGLTPSVGSRKEGEGIVWWNYFDFGDPIGFELDTAREWLIEHGWIQADPAKQKADGAKVPADGAQQRFFDFPETQEKGFTRYPFPGKAHNDYWGDKQLFDHFFSEGMKLEPRKKDAPLPRTYWLLWPISWVLPYVLVALLLIFGTYLVYDNLADVIHTEKESTKEMVMGVLGLAALLAGITLVSRVPRLVPIGGWYLLPLTLFPLCAAAYYYGVSNHTAKNLGDALGAPADKSRWAMIAVALGVALLSAFVSKWRPKWGMWPLMLLSGATVVFIIARLLTLQTHQEDPKLWPVVLAAAAFLYLWWLAAHLFDLIFVWHRYIRSSLANKMLRGFQH